MCLGVSPYDYNSLVVKSLTGNRCHAGQICGLGSNIYSHRLRHSISELFDIPSKHITGFTLGNTSKLTEPYWSSITINGQSIKLEKDDNREMEEHFVSQSLSNNTPQNKYQTIKLNTTNNEKTIKTYKYFMLFFSFALTSVLPGSNIQKIVKQNFDQKQISSSYSKKYVNERISVRIQQWLHSLKSNHRTIN